MAHKVYHIVALLESLAQKADGQSLDLRGFNVMSDKMMEAGTEEISARYLYDLYRKMQKKEATDEVAAGRRTHMLDIIAKYLDFDRFSHFESAYDKPISNVVMACVGNWWSYVRANNNSDILKAPVKIFYANAMDGMQMELRGQERKFNGRLKEKGNCFSGFIESDTDKRIGLVFRLGATNNINLLQGVFCGLSNSGDPIAGREILVREKEMKYEKMEWSRHKHNDEKIDARIRKYFWGYERNCIKVMSINGFNLDDLGE